MELQFTVALQLQIDEDAADALLDAFTLVAPDAGAALGLNGGTTWVVFSGDAPTIPAGFEAGWELLTESLARAGLREPPVSEVRLRCEQLGIVGRGLGVAVT